MPTLDELIAQGYTQVGGAVPQQDAPVSFGSVQDLIAAGYKEAFEPSVPMAFGRGLLAQGKESLEGLYNILKQAAGTYQQYETPGAGLLANAIPLAGAIGKTGIDLGSSILSAGEEDPIGTLEELVPFGKLIGAAASEAGGGQKLTNAQYADLAGRGTADIGTFVAAPGTAGKAGAGLARLGKAGQMSAVGITSPMLRQSMQWPGASKVFKKFGSTPLAEAFDRAAAQRLFKGSKSGANIQNNAVEIKNKLEASLQGLLSKADSVAKDVAIPDYKITKEFIAKSNTKRTELQKAFDEITGELNKNLDGSLVAVNNAKRELYDEVYGEAGVAKEALREYLAADLKNTIENTVDRLGKSGDLPNDVIGKVKALNQDYGVILSMKKPIASKVALDESRDLAKMAQKIVSTTGGAGTGLISSLVTGDPTFGLIMGLGGQALFNPGARYATGALLRGMAAPLQTAGELTPSLGQAAALNVAAGNPWAALLGEGQ